MMAVGASVCADSISIATSSNHAAPPPSVDAILTLRDPFARPGPAPGDEGCW
jgi:hypothetical protein